MIGRSSPQPLVLWMRRFSLATLYLRFNLHFHLHTVQVWKHVTWWEKRAPRASPKLMVFAVKLLWILRIFLPFLASPVFVHCAQFWWHQPLSWKWNHSYSMVVESQQGVQWLFNGLLLIDCNIWTWYLHCCIYLWTQVHWGQNTHLDQIYRLLFKVYFCS